MASDISEMNLRDFGRVLVDRKWFIVLAVTVSVATSVLLSALQPSVYSAEAELLVLPRNQQEVFTDEERVSDRSILTEIKVIESDLVRNSVRDQLGLDADPPKVKASQLSGTDVIELVVEDTDAASAQILVTTYTDTYIVTRREQSSGTLNEATVEIQRAIDSLQAQVDSYEPFDPNVEPLAEQLARFKAILDQLRVDAALSTADAVVIKPAELPGVPIEPDFARDALLAAAIGLLLGLGAAFLVDYLDDRVRESVDLVAMSDKPVLAIVPPDPSPNLRPVALRAPTHAAVEAYRGLRTNLQFTGLDDVLRVIQVTSSLPGEGKTTTVANLAVVLAQAGHRVAVVDADLRRPQLHEVFGVPHSPGLTDLLLGGEPRGIVNQVAISESHRLSVYCAGTAASNPSEILGGHRMRQLMTDMQGHYDYVIVDSAPVLPVTDSVALASAVDGVLVVVHAGEVDRGDVADTIDRLKRVSARTLGFVLNQALTTDFEIYPSSAYPSEAGGATQRDVNSIPVEA